MPSERRTFLKQLGATLLAGTLPVSGTTKTPEEEHPIQVLQTQETTTDPKLFKYVRFAQDPNGEWCRQYSNDRQVWVTHRGKTKVVLNRGGNR